MLAYEPDERPEQRLETFKSPVETTKPAAFLQATLGAMMGRAAQGALDALAGPLRDSLAAHLEAGKSIAVLVAHAGGFEDMGVFAGAVAVSLDRPELIARNGVIVNKVMTCETFKGYPIRDLYRYFANVYWVIPDTESAERWGLDDELARFLNVNATRTVVADMRSGGVVLTFAPGGTAMREKRDESGELVSLEIPAVASGTISLISRFDAYLCGASWKDTIALGPIRPVTSPDDKRGPARSAHRIELARAVLDEMAALTQQLASTTVTVEAYLPA